MLQSVGTIQSDQPAPPNFADYVRRTVEPVEPTEEQLQFRNYVLRGGRAADEILVPELDLFPETVENLTPPSEFLPEDVPEF